MAQFQVPQFIEVEDKIIGPLTLKQFVYIAGGGGAAFLAWRFLPGFISLFIAIPLAGAGLALAFMQINKKPLIFVLEAAFNYLVKSKLYLWKNVPKKADTESGGSYIDSMLAASDPEAVVVPKLTEGSLTNIAWNLDIHERLENADDATHKLQNIENYGSTT